MPTTSRAKGRAGNRRGEVAERTRRARAAEAAAADEARRALERAAMARDEAWRSAEAANRRRVRTVLAAPFAPGLVLAALGAVVLALVFVGAAFLVLWAVAAVLLYRSARDGFAARLMGSRPPKAVAEGHVAPSAAARLEDVTESLCAVLGLSVPLLLVVIDPAANAVSTGAAPGQSTLVVTSGLLDRLERIELEAVVAHELAHIKRGDTLSGGLAAALRRLAGFAGEPVGRLARYLEGPDRELVADLAAVQATRYPPGLIAALQECERGGSLAPATVPGRLFAETETQWLLSSESAASRGGGFGLAERLEVLVEL